VSVVLVTGGSGGLGRRLVRALRGEGRRVRCLVHHRPVPEADETASGDLRDPGALERAATGVDAVIHLAAVTHARSERAYRAVNVEGARNLLEAASRAGVGRFVHASTRAIDRSGGAYSRSKADAEDAVRASGLAFAIVRLPEVFGVGAAEGVDAILARARAGRPVPVVGNGSHEVCPVHADDAVAALAAALEAPPGRTYTLAGECMSVRVFAERSIVALGSRSRIVGIPEAAVAVLSRVSRALPLPLYPDQLARLRAPKPAPTPEARAELRFEPRPLEEALAG
jgi:NADH dehydrogenase